MITYRQPFVGEYPITQRFGETYTSKSHTGIDYACPAGTSILASADGTIIYAGWKDGGYGYCVFLRHPDGNMTIYEHLSSVSVKVGQALSMSDVLGYSGSTGNSTGPHLHFEARDQNNKAFDPMRLPLISVDDSIQPVPDTEQESKPVIPVGVCQIVCDAAFVRDWENIQRQHLIYKGERLYAFADVKFYNGLPYRFIGAGMCVAEYDAYGTQILGTVE